MHKNNPKDMDMDHKEKALLSEYRKELATYREQNNGRVAPEWAYQYQPPIPWVGDGYETPGRPKVLIYASAENLTYTKKYEKNPDEKPSYLKGDDQMLRSRICHTEYRGTHSHIQPINNASLLIAARHALTGIDHEGVFSLGSPETFLDEVAVANPGKFSINAQTNKDYAGDGTPWLASKPFIEIDLAVLDPDIIIVPRTIRDTLAKNPVGLNLSAKERIIAPNYQITARTINKHIRSQLQSIGSTKKPSPVDHWKVSSGRLDMATYLHWLDEVAVHWVERH